MLFINQIGFDSVRQLHTNKRTQKLNLFTHSFVCFVYSLRSLVSLQWYYSVVIALTTIQRLQQRYIILLCSIYYFVILSRIRIIPLGCGKVKRTTFIQKKSFTRHCVLCRYFEKFTLCIKPHKKQSKTSLHLKQTATNSFSETAMIIWSSVKTTNLGCAPPAHWINVKMNLTEFNKNNWV